MISAASAEVCSRLRVFQSFAFRVVFARGTGGHVLVTEFRRMALNGLFCADLLRPLDLSPLTHFTYKYRPVCIQTYFSIDTTLHTIG